MPVVWTKCYLAEIWRESQTTKAAVFKINPDFGGKNPGAHSWHAGEHHSSRGHVHHMDSGTILV